MVIDYSKITNENCGIFYEIPISTTDLYIKTSTIDNAELQKHSSLKIQLGNTKTITKKLFNKIII